ncbi:MAG: hypothetical protein C0425_08580 [Chlorobiaceae bacterium]|nr:hypothetical protein [Chlorobiaceae bacterium]MBA4310376.1 hypothetical protein [Chlorobiaceae bacterium]
MKKYSFLLLLSLFFFIGCDVEENVTDPTADTSKLSVNLSNLPVLGDSARFEAWLLLKNVTRPILLGRLELPATATSYTGEFNVTLGNLQRAEAVVISIESVRDSVGDSTMSPLRITGGFIQGNRIDFTAMNSKAMNVDFSKLAGRFQIFTPTNTANTGLRSGIWFIDTVGAGLTIPPPPTGWTYQAWLKVGNNNLNIGRFTSAAGGDTDSTFKGTGVQPLFPGSDFITNAPAGLTFPLDVTNAELFITLEPVATAIKINSPTSMKIFSKVISSTDAVRTSIPFPVVTSGLPTGAATLIIDVK